MNDVTALDSECFKRATIMLCAEDLLDAAQYAVTLLGRLTSEDFAAGGDRPAREKLQEAINNATEWVHLDPRRFEKTVDEEVRDAVLNNVL